MRPTFRFLFSHPFHLLACGFGSGLSPKGPGTAGTLAAWLLYPLIRYQLSEPVFLFLLLGCFVVGIIACDRTGRDLGVSDHGSIVWDEIVAFWLVLFFTPATLLWQAFAFVLFRLFDITKPPPIRQADARIKGGFGVMLDDILAAGYSLLVLAVAVRVAGFL